MWGAEVNSTLEGFLRCALEELVQAGRIAHKQSMRVGVRQKCTRADDIEQLK